MLIEKTKLTASGRLVPTQTQMAIDFFVLLAVCNTVIVARAPHKDTMNASGIICPTAKIDMDPEPSGATSTATAGLNGRGGGDGDLESSETVHQADAAASLPSTSGLPAAAAPPLMPDPSLRTPARRPNRLWDLLPSKPLSPIDGSPIEPNKMHSPLPPLSRTPTGVSRVSEAAGEEDAAAPNFPGPAGAAGGGSVSSKSKLLQVPNLLTPLSRLMNSSTVSLLSKAGSRSATPSPATGGPDAPKPIYEAESPDELALVDAAYAYHCKLVKRTPTQVINLIF